MTGEQVPKREKQFARHHAMPRLLGAFFIRVQNFVSVQFVCVVIIDVTAIFKATHYKIVLVSVLGRYDYSDNAFVAQGAPIFGRRSDIGIEMSELRKRLVHDDR